MAITKRIDLFIRPTSTITKEKAIEYAYKRANEKDTKDKTLAHYYDVTDSRTGEKYMVFGNRAKDILKLSKSFDIVNKTDIIKGYTDEVVISSDDGVCVVKLPSSKDSYNVFLSVKDSLRAIARVEDEQSDSFEIVLYDGEAFSQDNIKLDCSANPITVNYVVLYE